MSAQMWGIWAVVLIAQNFSFTFVSRARNSGSIKRHMIAGLASNGVWFISQIIAVGAFLNILSGRYGWAKAIGAGAFYTLFTLVGSLLAHQYALKSETGKSAVGANSKYALIPVADWETAKRRLLID